MRTVFTAEGLNKCPNLVIVRAHVEILNLDYLLTVIFKLGFRYSNDAAGIEYGKINFLTDGMFIPLGENLEQVAEKLNKDNIGYRPLNTYELIKILNSTDIPGLKY